MVLPFPYAVFLKQKGVSQQSLFYWVEEKDGHNLKRHPLWDQLLSGHEILDLVAPANHYSAFLFDELWHALEDSPQIKKNEIELLIKFRNRISPVSYTVDDWSFSSHLLEYIIYVDEINSRTQNRNAQKTIIKGQQIQTTNLNDIPNGKAN
ncbi:MAG: hypothetical protein ACXVNO_00230 [Bacteroidia bacterium]